MLAACGNITVVDGGSTDGTVDAAPSYADAGKCPTMPGRFGGAPCDATGSACISTCATCPAPNSYAKPFGNGELYVCSDGGWQLLDWATNDLCFGPTPEYTDPECTIRYEAGVDASSD